MANFYKDNKYLRFQFDHPLMKRIVALKEQDFKDSGQFDYAPCTADDAIDSYDKVMEIMGDICGNIIALNAENVDKSGPVHHEGRVYYASGTKQNQDVLTQAGM